MADLGRCADCGTAGSGMMLDGQRAVTAVQTIGRPP
jgi:hypothetical protein